MRARKLTLVFVTFTLSLLVPHSATAQNVATQGPPYGRTDATIDLRTKEGAELAKAVWRYSDVKIVETGFRAPGPDLKPSGKPTKTYDYIPHAGGADFDDSQWEALDPTMLEARRSGGKVCFNWYRINITIPNQVGEFETRGSTVDFEIVIDDYAEVWVDGKLPAVYGQSGGSVNQRLQRSEPPGHRPQRCAGTENSACCLWHQWTNLSQPEQLYLG